MDKMTQSGNRRATKPKGGKAKKSTRFEKNNFQDNFAKREFDKGERVESARDCKFGKQKMNQRDVSNDSSWYFKDKKVLNDVASYSYSTSLGADAHFEQAYPNDRVMQTLSSMPGVMGIELAISPGISIDAQSPINLAAQNVYSFVRYKNSGAANYDAPDLMLYLIAMDSLYSAWNWMKRIYCYVSGYTYINRYIPAAYAALDCIDIDDIYANLADFRAYLNMAASRISAFCVPATMTYMVRHSWLFSNIYKDSDTTKAQSYMYVPSFFYAYDEASSPKGGILTPLPIKYNYTYGTSTPLTFKNLRTLLDTMINNLQYSEDIGIMSGDIKKSYESNLFTLSPIDADSAISAVYSSEVLSQFENAMLSGIGQTPINQFQITQDPDTNFIKYQPIITGGAFSAPEGFYLNFHKESPTPEEVIVASRLLYAGQHGSSNFNEITLLSCGSEIALRLFIATYQQGTNPTAPVAPNTQQSLVIMSQATNITVNASTTVAQVRSSIANVFDTVAKWNAFDWAPQIMLHYVDVVTSSNSFSTSPLKDWDVYTTLDLNDISSMNELALLSMFNVPN